MTTEQTDQHSHQHAGNPAPDSGFSGSGLQRGASLAVRLGLGGVLVVAGGLKIADPKQAALAVQAYQILPTQLAELVGYGLPLIEVGLGVLLIIGLGTRVAAVASGALMTAFVVGVVSAWARGLSIDCGCFGGGGAVPEGEAAYLPVLLRDGFFVLMAGWLVVYPASLLALDRAGRAGTGDLGLYDEFDEDDVNRDNDVFDTDRNEDDVNDGESDDGLGDSGPDPVRAAPAPDPPEETDR